MVNKSVKKAVLLSFSSERQPHHEWRSWPAVTLIKSKPNFQIGAMNNLPAGVRVVHLPSPRKGWSLPKALSLMPSYVNRCSVMKAPMVNTWATVGSCTKWVKTYISGGVGIGGVLEPLRADPTIIEATALSVRAREIVEGVIVKRKARWFWWACYRWIDQNPRPRKRRNHFWPYPTGRGGRASTRAKTLRTLASVGSS